MGFGTVASHIILFITLITITTTVAITFRGYVSSSGSAMTVQQDILVNSLKTDITLTLVSYNSLPNPGVTTVYLTNTGKTKLDVNLTDIFIDGLRFRRNSTERNITVLNDTDLVNPGIWDPDETVEINAFRNLTAGSHVVVVTTSHGGKDSDTFST